VGDGVAGAGRRVRTMHRRGREGCSSACSHESECEGRDKWFGRSVSAGIRWSAAIV
jgi:hypothetical protein